MDFITNRYALNIISENDSWKMNGQNGDSPLEILLRNLLLHKNKEGFDPYHLALLIKDASASRLLEEKMSKQNKVEKSQF